MKHQTISPTLSALLKARTLIEANWGKGPCIGPQVCAVEAIWRNWSSSGSTEAVNRLHEALPDYWFSVMHYNDHPTTTKADILALYDRAIDLAIEHER